MRKKNGMIVGTVVLLVGILVGTILLVNKQTKEVSGKIKNGLSAYEIAVQYGYEGTVQEWVESLSGKSAYEIAVENGYSGSEKEWISSLEASKDNSVSIKDAKFNSKGELLITLSDDTELNLGVAVGKDGAAGAKGQDGKDGIVGAKGQDGKDGIAGVKGQDGKNGKDGVDGKNGVDGVSIASANINEKGQLVISYSDGKSVNLDTVVGMNGKDGVSVTASKINEKGELVLFYSNGQEANLGVVVGAAGKDGINGMDGKDGSDGKDGINGKDGAAGKDGLNGQDGISVVKSEINLKGELVLTYSDGEIENLGIVVGAAGKDGINGTDGKDGADGKDGINGKDGADGKDGVNGQDGVDGQDGISVTGAEITSTGELVLTYSNNQRSNLGVVIGADGKDGLNGQDGADGKNGNDGISVVKSEINSNGELVLTYSDNRIENLGAVIGAAGKDGVDGKDGLGIAKTEINALGELIVTYTDGSFDNLGVVVSDGTGTSGTAPRVQINADTNEWEISTDGGHTWVSTGVKATGADGKDGANGQDGKDGVDGVAGQDGVGIKEIIINENDELVISLTNETTLNLGCIKGADGADGKDGVNGQDGKDGTDGVNGQDGQDGADGVSVSGAVINDANELVLSFSDNTEKNLGVVVGANGQDGADGKDGADGVNGQDGKDGIGIAKTEINALGELVVTYTDGTSDNLGVIVSDNGGAGTGAIAPRVQINSNTNEWEISTDGGHTWTSTGVKATGADGKDGADGQDGKDGVNGQDGADGKDGINGQDGKDAIAPKIQINSDNEWEISIDNGATWASTGVKATGADGKDGLDGTNGQDGADGKDGVNGQDGKDGVDGTDGIGISGAKIDISNHLILTLSDNSSIDVGVVVGADGKDGVDGKDGANGQDGKDGIGIKNVTVSEEGVLTVTLDNGTVLTLGNIKGKDGVGIAKSEINADGNLVLTYTDGKVVTLGNVVGTNGIGIKSLELTADYMLKITYTDGNVQTLGPVRGEKGEKGDKGEPGADGKTPYIKDGNWWIGNINTGIKAEGTAGIDGVSVVNSYVDENYHLWMELSDGTKIDAGYVGVPIDEPSPVKHTVTFKDWDGTVLKTEEVESGKSATAPEDPTRDGYTFTGWNQPFSNVISDMVVIAQYQKITTPTIFVKNVYASAGETVQVPIMITNNPGVAGAKIKLTYNTALTLNEAVPGEAFAILDYTKPPTLVSSCLFNWDSLDQESKADGAIMNLSFTVPTNANSGDKFEISCSYVKGDIYDVDLDDVDLEVLDGYIMVK